PPAPAGRPDRADPRTASGRPHLCHRRPRHGVDTAHLAASCRHGARTQDCRRFTGRHKGGPDGACSLCRALKMAAAATNATQWLVVRGLVAGYSPGIDILRGLSVAAPRGQVRCVLGPNGTGKSTLLKVLFGFLSARQGEIQYNGKPAHSLAPYHMGSLGVAY